MAIWPKDTSCSVCSLSFFMFSMFSCHSLLLWWLANQLTLPALIRSGRSLSIYHYIDKPCCVSVALPHRCESTLSIHIRPCLLLLEYFCCAHKFYFFPKMLSTTYCMSFYGQCQNCAVNIRNKCNCISPMAYSHTKIDLRRDFFIWLYSLYRKCDLSATTKGHLKLHYFQSL